MLLSSRVMTTSTPISSDPERPVLTRGLMTLLVVSLLATVPTLHYQTPMLGAIGLEFSAGPAAVGWVPTMTFSGFLAGTALLIPLGDRLDMRRLVLVKIAVLVVAVLAMALAPSLAALAAASFVTGVCASASQHMVPLVAALAQPHERGRAVGPVLSGLFLGVLLGRLIGGFVASQLGWRYTYFFSALTLLAMLPALIKLLPSMTPRTNLSYGVLMRSLPELLRKHAPLRHASATQCLLGVCYGSFWATLAPMLMLLHGLGPAAAGLIAIPGAAGILVARPAGRWMDRHGAGTVVRSGACSIMAAFVVLGLAQFSIIAIVLGAMLLDAGLRATMVANQTVIMSVDPAARSRTTTLFVSHVWAGNAVGALLASIAFTHAGWLAVCALALTASGAALLFQLLSRRA